MKLKKVFYIVLGCAGLGLGALGAVLPLLPAFPFLLLARAQSGCTTGLLEQNSIKTIWRAMSRERA